MTRRFLTTVAAVFATSTAFAAPLPKDLTPKPVEHDGGTYRVTFPCKPEVQTTKGRDNLGAFTQTMALQVSEPGRSAHIVVVRESDTNFETGYDAETIAEMFRGNARKLGTVVEDRVSSIGSNVVARWLVFKGNDGLHHRSLVFVRGTRLYVLLASGADLKTVNGKAATRFFDSFVLTK